MMTNTELHDRRIIKSQLDDAANFLVNSNIEIKEFASVAEYFLECLDEEMRAKGFNEMAIRVTLEDVARDIETRLEKGGW